MDYMEPDVRCLPKAVKLNHSHTHILPAFYTPFCPLNGPFPVEPSKAMLSLYTCSMYDIQNARLGANFTTDLEIWYIAAQWFVNVLNSFEFQIEFHWNMFLRICLIVEKWCRQATGEDHRRAQLGLES